MRLQLIMAFLNVPGSLADFGDPRLTYKVVSDERAYQAECLTAFQRGLSVVTAALADAPEDPQLQEQRAKYETDIQSCRNATSNLFTILKRLTGMTKRTGGTNYLPDIDALPPVSGTWSREKVSTEGLIALLTGMLASARTLAPEDIDAIKSFRLRHLNLNGALTEDAVTQAIVEGGAALPIAFYLDAIDRAHSGRATMPPPA